MKKFLTSAVLTFGLVSASQGAIIATLQEAENGAVDFSIEVTNPDGFDYSGLNATHLDYIFFDDMGDFINGPVLGSNSPAIFQPVSHGLVGTSSDGFTIGIQAIALDNDDDVPNDEDDFVLRFVGQTTGLTNGVTPLNFETFLDFGPVRIRDLSFDALNPGSFNGQNARADAIGGFQLNVVALEPVPVPASLPLLAGGLFAAGTILRRRKARSQA